MNVGFISAYFQILELCEENKSLKNTIPLRVVLAYSSRRQKDNIIQYHARVKTVFWHLDLLLQ